MEQTPCSSEPSTGIIILEYRTIMQHTAPNISLRTWSGTVFMLVSFIQFHGQLLAPSVALNGGLPCGTATPRQQLEWHRSFFLSPNATPWFLGGNSGVFGSPPIPGLRYRWSLHGVIGCSQNNPSSMAENLAKRSKCSTNELLYAIHKDRF